MLLLLSLFCAAPGLAAAGNIANCCGIKKTDAQIIADWQVASHDWISLLDSHVSVGSSAGRSLTAAAHTCLAEFDTWHMSSLVADATKEQPLRKVAYAMKCSRSACCPESIFKVVDFQTQHTPSATSSAIYSCIDGAICLPS